MKIETILYQAIASPFGVKLYSTNVSSHRVQINKLIAAEPAFKNFQVKVMEDRPGVIYLRKLNLDEEEEIDF